MWQNQSSLGMFSVRCTITNWLYFVIVVLKYSSFHLIIGPIPSLKRGFTSCGNSNSTLFLSKSYSVKHVFMRVPTNTFNKVFTSSMSIDLPSANLFCSNGNFFLPILQFQVLWDIWGCVPQIVCSFHEYHSFLPW